MCTFARLLTVAAGVGTLLLTGACGQKGPLRLPAPVSMPASAANPATAASAPSAVRTSP